MDKYFMHRIKEENGTITAGIEVHDTKDSAIRSFHGYMKQGYGNPDFPNITFVACFVENPLGGIEPEYDALWSLDGGENKFFFHHTRQENGVISKAIDAYNSMEEAEYRFHAEMEYGYGNPNHPNVTYQSCKITEKLSRLVLKDETWVKPEEPTPEPEPETETVG